METKNEIWKDIEGYEGYYQVSNLGRVKSLKRFVERYVKGRYQNLIVKERILKPRLSKKSYYRVSLSNGFRTFKDLQIHRLVAQAFIPNPDKLPQVNHKDENHLNNSVWVNLDGSIDFEKSNLEWCDDLYNNNYGTRNKRIAKANSMPVIMMDNDGNDLRYFNSINDAARWLGGMHFVSAISRVCRGIKPHVIAGGHRWRYADK